MVKNLSANAGDAGSTDSVPGLKRSPRGGHGNPLKYSCLDAKRNVVGYSPWNHKESDMIE